MVEGDGEEGDCKNGGMDEEETASSSSTTTNSNIQPASSTR